MLLFHAQYLSSQGSVVAERAVFAETLQRAYELAIEAAANPIQAISASWVTIKEDPAMFQKHDGQDFWASPFKPVPVEPVRQLAWNAAGKAVVQ